jgi:hypothetical protein
MVSFLTLEVSSPATYVMIQKVLVVVFPFPIIKEAVFFVIRPIDQF